MNLRLLLATPLVLTLLATERPAPDEISFAPREGLVLVKTFRLVQESEQESSSDEGGDTTSSHTMEQVLVVQDVMLSTDDGRVTKLKRRYDEIASEMESETDSFHGGSRDSSRTDSSDLEGSTVIFEWDEDEHVASSDEVDAETLQELPYDLDFVALLPGDEVSEGDEWDVDVEAFGDLANPWRGIPWEHESSDGETMWGDEDDERVEPEVDESTDGDMVATYQGTREIDGVTVAVVALEGEVETERSVEGRRDHEHGSTSFSIEMSETRRIEGELLWNIGGGHLHSLRIETEEESEGTSENTIIFGDQEFESDSEDEGSGTLTLTVTFKEGEAQ